MYPFWYVVLWTEASKEGPSPESPNDITMARLLWYWYVAHPQVETIPLFHNKYDGNNNDNENHRNNHIKYYVTIDNTNYKSDVRASIDTYILHYET